MLTKKQYEDGVQSVVEEFKKAGIIITEEEKAKIEEEVMEAKRQRKELEKQRREKQKTVKGDKFVEEVIEDKDEAEKIRQRLERARALDREKYGETYWHRTHQMTRIQ